MFDFLKMQRAEQRELHRSRMNERLVEAVRQFDHEPRRALYAATNSGALRRGTWHGCALNRAGGEMDRPIANEQQAAIAFRVPVEQIRAFLDVWDHLPGSDRHCTAWLREALLEVGLFAPERTDADEQATAEDPDVVEVPQLVP